MPNQVPNSYPKCSGKAAGPSWTESIAGLKAAVFD